MTDALPEHSLSAIEKSPTALTQSAASKPKSFMARVKAWAWRFTAGYFWLHTVLILVTGRDPLSNVETAITVKAVATLSFLGFAPVNAGHLPLVFLTTWLLLITTFSPVQLLLGLPAYIFVFPFTALLVSFYRKTLKDASPQDTSAQTTEPARHFPLLSISIAMLVGWFVLYSGSSSRGPNLIGFALALALFCTLVYQALDKTSPVDEQDAALFSKAAIWGISYIGNAAKGLAANPPKTKFAVARLGRMPTFVIGKVRCIGILIHGRKGRERIAMIMLLEYIVFLVLVAVSAILFWALAIKAVVPSEQALPLTTALRISASHFLPGIQDSSPSSLPWWTAFGPALTSWVLFVVYIGPVGAALPVQQEAFLKRMKPAQTRFVELGKAWSLYRKLLRTLEERLPATEAN